LNKTNILLSSLALLSIVFAAVSMVSPWWTVEISPEAREVLNSDFRSDYNLLKTVSASYTDNSLTENATTSIEVNVSNLTSSQEQSPPSFGFMDTTLLLTGAGLALTIPMAIGTLITRAHKYMRYIVIAGYVAALLLIIAPLYFSEVMPAQVSSLSSISPIDIPNSWIKVYPGDITSLWGGKTAGGSPISTWLPSGNFWVWQASFGWFLAFSAGFLNIVACLAARMFTKKEKTPPSSGPNPGTTVNLESI
jgi:hypothetical protein